jgi:hypothetical protein
MLYKFKSQATADIIMLHDNGLQMLQIIGKDDTPQGIITVAQMPAAIAALEAAVLAHEAAQQRAQANDADDEENQPKGDGVMLRQRAAPFIDMLRRAAAEGKDVVWGV